MRIEEYTGCCEVQWKGVLSCFAKPSALDKVDVPLDRM